MQMTGSGHFATRPPPRVCRSSSSGWVAGQGRGSRPRQQDMGRAATGRLISGDRASFDPAVSWSERDILERTVKAVSERAVAASGLVDEAFAAGLDGSHPVTLQAKMLRLELLEVKADLERELGTWMLDCTACSQTVHWGLRPRRPG